MTKLPEESDRKAVFMALIELQDARVTVADSRRRIAERFEVSIDDVILIEREGLDKHWLSN